MSFSQMQSQGALPFVPFVADSALESADVRMLASAVVPKSVQPREEGHAVLAREQRHRLQLLLLLVLTLVLVPLMIFQSTSRFVESRADVAYKQGRDVVVTLAQMRRKCLGGLVPHGTLRAFHVAPAKVLGLGLVSPQADDGPIPLAAVDAPELGLPLTVTLRFVALLRSCPQKL